MPALARRSIALLLALLAAGCAQHILPAATPSGIVAPEELETSLFLIGDAGEPRAGGEPVLIALARQLAEAPAKSIVVFLGDNSYPLGIPDPSDPTYTEAVRRLADQVAAVRDAGATGYMVPGNHDWRRGRAGGLASVQRADVLADSAGKGKVVQEPGNGCPGPVVIDPTSHLRLVLVDTQWFLQSRGDERPEGTGTGCVAGMGAAYDSIRTVLGNGAGRHVVIATHHPVASGGEHAGFFTWKDHLFPLTKVQSWLWLPLPIIGSAYPIARKAGISDQDFGSGRYGAMRDSLLGIMAEHPPLVFASGHDHSQQVISLGPLGTQLVTGAGIYGHLDPVHSTDGTRVAISESGFMRLDIARNGHVRLGVHVVDAQGGSKEVYSQWLVH